MTKRLGFSIYPEKSTVQENLDYIDLAAKYQFKRMFTCFLSVSMTKEELFEKYQPLIFHARNLGIETYVDVYPSFFENMAIPLDDLSFFHEIGATGFRLDKSFSGSEESLMSYNPYGLKIEVNLSNDTSYIKNLFDYEPNRENIVGCHNFYPQKYTGLDEDFFVQSTAKYNQIGLHTAAFVSSSVGAIGPWDVSEGQPTLERDRTLPIDLQARGLWAGSVVDDLIIGNAFASEAELKALSEIDPHRVNLTLRTEDSLDALEEKITFTELHFQRGDISAYMVRSTTGRSKYQHQVITKRESTPTIKRGDVLLANSTYGIYAGELQIALKDRENDGHWNRIGWIPEEEHFLLDYITPWKKFIFRKEGLA